MIIAVAGRRVDPPDTNQERFPATMVKSVKEEIVEFFRKSNAGHVVCSAACGTDLLAIQAAKELDVPITIVLPFNSIHFKTSSVVDRPGDWGDIYDHIIKELIGSPRLIELNYEEKDPEVYTKTNLKILDEAKRLSERNRQTIRNAKDSPDSVVALIVWEGKPKDADDTTHHFMLEAQKRKFETREIRSV